MRLAIVNNVIVIKVEANPQRLDTVFGALADPTRRTMLMRLCEGPASVAELGAPFEMSQPAVSRHLKILENAGLVTRDVAGQRRPARLRAAVLSEAVDWLAYFRTFWEDSFDSLDEVLTQLNSDDPDPTAPK